jgi:2'-5' RNA ligase superfamily protein
MDATRSALIVPVPEAEEAVGRFRASLDRAAFWGVPAHVTVLYPFLPPGRIDDAVLAAVGATVAAVPAFTAVFRRIGWFGDTVAWLAPEPDGPFRDLTAALWRRFPETPPYAGEHPDSTPHLTIGHDHPRPVLERAAASVAGRMPVTAAVGRVRLIRGSDEPDSWHTVAEFPLGRAHREL